MISLETNQIEKYKKLGCNISYYRKLAGFTQLTMAEKLGISRVHMGKIENGAIGVSLDVIFNLSDILNVPVKNLFDFRELGY